MNNQAIGALIDPRRERAGFLNGAWLRATGRSWWQAKYADGHEISEWQTLKDLGNVESSRWQETPRKGMRALRVLCPNGEVGEVSASSDHKLFQLRQSVFAPGFRAQTLAHLIGVVVDANGGCDCFVWEPAYLDVQGVKVPGRLVGPFQDNVLAMRYGTIGPLGLDALGLVL
jgi:hypothetical protein